VHDDSIYAGMTPLPLQVYIGYDPLETCAYHVLAQSIIEHATQPVQIVAVALHHLERNMWRERDPKQSTDFAFSRFLVPCMSNYEGYSLFLDSDMLAMDDISKLFAYARYDRAVSVVQHDYTPTTSRKMQGMDGPAGAEQTIYEKKNWSSVMLFNNRRCRKLTPGYVNNATGLELHQFKWLEDDSEIGELPLEWNWLVGEYPRKDDVKLAHYTLGGPWLEKYKDCDYSNEWREVFAQVMDQSPAWGWRKKVAV
jgi:lipopolysaccharide biosynthesis glycosyltransferase